MRLLAAALPRPVAYVLGGGASFGAVQVGQLRALAETDLRPDLVVGTSVGSLNGAMLAEDAPSAADRLATVWSSVDRTAILPGGWLRAVRTIQASRAHLAEASGLRALLARHVAARTFADLPLPFAAVATDFVTGRPYVFTSGDLEPAVLASSAIPGILPAVDHDGRRLVDGGLVANVPVLQALDLGARSLVVLDCGVLGLRDSPPHNLVETMLHTAAVVVRQQVVRDVPAAAAQVPLVYLPGPFPMITSPLDFRHTATLVQAAYAGSRAFLSALLVDGPVPVRSPAAARPGGGRRALSPPGRREGQPTGVPSRLAGPPVPADGARHCPWASSPDPREACVRPATGPPPLPVPLPGPAPARRRGRSGRAWRAGRGREGRR